MAQLLVLSDSHQNMRSPPTATRNNYKTTTTTTTSSHTYVLDNDAENLFDYRDDIVSSSPFVADVDPTLRSPMKGSPSKQRSPQKKSLEKEGVPLTENALRENEGLAGMMKATEDLRLDGLSEAGNDTMSMVSGHRGFGGADDTCYSAFSAVANTDMTTFDCLGQSPARSSPTKSSKCRDEARTSRHNRPNTPLNTGKRDYDPEFPSPSPTPRRNYQGPVDDTNLILDFTEQLNAFSQAPSRSPTRASPAKYQSQADIARHRLRSPTREGFQPATPSEARHLANLLDFDLPPAPTPRSIPTITPRELETLKSTFFSEISSLKASLSGKEAEINSLKTAKDDAERRVGEAAEKAHEALETNANLLLEKAGWEARDKETQNVLRSVKEEIRLGSKEREELAAKVVDLNRRLEEAETRATSAESSLAGLRASTSSPAVEPAAADGAVASTPGSGAPNKMVEAAVERVARELHALYKTKHETKVGALKKSYEARWEKKIRELQTRLDEITRENEELKVGRDATISSVLPGLLIHSQSGPDAQLLEEQRLAETKAAEAERAELVRRTEELKAELDAAQKNVEVMKAATASLDQELAVMRKENSDLVTMVDDFLMMEMDTAAPAPAAATAVHAEPPAPPTSEHHNGRPGTGAPAAPKASGLRGPGFGLGESRIGMMKRSTSGNTGRSGGMMSNIERMGRGRAVE